MKKITYTLLAAVCALSFTACSHDDEPKPNPDAPTQSEGVFVLNQGNYTLQIEGSLTLIGSDGQVSQNVFATANKRSLGATPQTAITYGDKIYIGVYESNTIEVIDRNTFVSEKQISLAGAEGQGPRGMVAKEGKVYISMYNGYVSRLDTGTLTIDKTVKVGPNPENMAIRGNYLYVPNSGGMNWQNGYNNTASKINLSTFEVEKEFEVSVNPTKFVSNGSDLFLLCMGNYGDIPSAVYRIDASDASEKIAEATLVDMAGTSLYYIYAPYWEPKADYKVYDIASGNTADMLADEGVDSPAAIAVDPLNGNIVITSYCLENGYTAYTIPGYAKIYNAKGEALGRYDAGITPVCIFFNYK